VCDPDRPPVERRTFHPSSVWVLYSYNRDMVHNIIGFLIFTLVLLIRLACHALWRDEVQAWLIAASASRPYDLLVVPSEGHPPLWYWVLFPFASLGFGPWFVKVPLAIFAIGTLVVVWLYSNLGIVEKILISGSYYLSWEYGIISRSYTLGTFLLCFFAALNRHWCRHPIAGALVLGLSSMTHIFFAMAAAGLAAVTVGQWLRTGGPSKRIVAFSVVFSAMLVFSAVTAGLSASRGLALATRLGSIVSSTGQMPDRTDEVVHNMGAAFTVGVFESPYAHFEALAICLAVLCFLRAPLFALIFVLTSLGIALFQSFVYGGAPWHFGSIYVLFVALYIIKSKETIAFAGRSLLLIPFLGGLLMLKPMPPYSRAEEAATIMKQHNVQFRRWAAYPDLQGIVAFAVLGRSFHSFECDCELTYINWGLRSRLRADTLRERIGRFVDAGAPRSSYVLVSQVHAEFLRSAISGDFRIEQIEQTGPAAYQDESFFLWRLTKSTR
jgi:hypothetical protein